jgi:hypothetical protein
MDLHAEASGLSDVQRVSDPSVRRGSAPAKFGGNFDFPLEPHGVGGQRIVFHPAGAPGNCSRTLRAMANRQRTYVPNTRLSTT